MDVLYRLKTTVQGSFCMALGNVTSESWHLRVAQVWPMRLFLGDGRARFRPS